MSPSPAGEQPQDQRLHELLERTEIHDTVLRYCRGIDRLDEVAVRACFHPDATDAHGSFTGTIDDFIAWAFDLLRKYDSTMHLVANHLCELRGDHAVAETYGIAFHRSSDPLPRRNLTVGFRYLDRFDKRDGVWRISHRVATTEWVRAPGEGSEWPIPADSEVGRRDSTDPLHTLLHQLNEE